MTAFMFPGQGSQVKGMGQELYSAYPQMRDVMDFGSDITGISLPKLCFETEPEKLNRTENAQLAVFAVSMGIFEILEAKGIRPSVLAGFSLGECSALCAAGVFSLRDGFLIVKERARVMQAVCDAGAGAMSAVLGLNPDVLLSDKFDARPVNFNCPGQIVISGSLEGVEKLEQHCLQMGARRIMRLPLSGAFHTAYMEPAAVELEKSLISFRFDSPKFTVYGNATGRKIEDFHDVPGHLARHMTQPVQWQRTIENILRSKKVKSFIEVGPGQTLTQFAKKIDAGILSYTSDSVEKLQKAAEAAD